MATVQAQATQWIKQALHFDGPFEAEIIALVPTIPLDWTTLPYCPACESVLCGACGHCHILDIVPFSRPLCPNDNDDMGHDCVAWYQALKAVVTVQRMSEESEE